MKRPITILFIFIISVQVVHQALIYTYYVINKDFISQELCESKNQPQLKCEGKCHLKKVLYITKKHSSTENVPFECSLEEIKVPTLFFQTIKQITLVSNTTYLSPPHKKGSFYYSFNYHFYPVFKTLHPPIKT